jgi:hypothetical protein
MGLKKLSFFRALNPASKHSGITYCLAKDWFGQPLPFQGQEMEDITVLENIRKAFNQDLSFFDAINATFDILLGNHYDRYLQGHGNKGALDFLILPLIARKLIADTYLTENTNSTFTNAISFVVAAPIELIRGASAVVLTAVLIPIVAVVHILRAIFSCLSQHEEKKPLVYKKS